MGTPRYVKQAWHRSANTVRVHSNEVPRVQFTGTEVEWWLPGVGAEGLAGKHFLGTDFRLGR